MIWSKLQFLHVLYSVLLDISSNLFIISFYMKNDSDKQTKLNHLCK